MELSIISIIAERENVGLAHNLCHISIVPAGGNLVLVDLDNKIICGVLKNWMSFEKSEKRIKGRNVGEGGGVVICKQYDSIQRWIM